MNMKKIVSAFLGFFFIFTAYAYSNSDQKIKLYTFFTPSHAVFKDEWFLPSIQDDYELIIKEFKQECPSGEYRSRGWKQTMMHKVDMMISAIEENWGSIVIYSDVDIQFFRPTKQDILTSLEGKDIVFQIESPDGAIGAGFFACKANEKTLHLFKEVKNVMIRRRSKTDQMSLNYLLRRTHRVILDWGYLPKTFFAGGTLTGTLWSPGTKLKIPKKIVLHHGNSTVGIKNKIAQLNYVKSQVLKRKKRSK